jgi:hypothetical protein
MEKGKWTTACSAHGHPEFEIEFNSESVLQLDVDWFFTYLADQVKQGVIFKPSQLIQVGWMMNRIERSKNGLTLFEPDFKEFPIKFVSGMTETFRQLRWQKSTAESVGLEAYLDFPTILHSGITCLRHEDSVDFVMDRAQSKNRDSGWFIGCNDPKHDHNEPANLRTTSLYELVIAKPACIPFLALPVHSFVRRVANRVEITLKNKVLKINENSFLERLQKLEPLRNGTLTV